MLGVGERIAKDRRAAWERWYRPMARELLGHGDVERSFVGDSSAAPTSGRGGLRGVGMAASTAQVLLVLELARAWPPTSAPRSARSASCAGSGAGRLAQTGLKLGRTMRARQAASGELPSPAVLSEGIRFEHVSFAYPGASRLALDDVSFSLPARAVVAIVGENGAGKTTLVKLLAKLYEPSSGEEIRIDGAPLSRMIATEQGAGRHHRGALQDFFRFEFYARQTIGLGEVGRMDDEPAVLAAAARAGADEVVARLPAGLDTQLGRTWPGGAEPSFGQWQKLSLARGFMREAPLVQVLDEPTAALDAETEHALFERYAAAARAEGDANGRITIFVSHRFSTVRMADLIIVLDGAHLVEAGSHEELMAHGGPYSELYRIQAAAYRPNLAEPAPA